MSGHQPVAPDTPRETLSLVVGKVKWFDATLQRGALADVGAASYSFERTDAERDLPPVARGELVTFTESGFGRLGRTATNVRPVVSHA